ncbi:hypothetical protein D3C72_2141710 [compost metagenome]
MADFLVGIARAAVAHGDQLGDEVRGDGAMFPAEVELAVVKTEPRHAFIGAPGQVRGSVQSRHLLTCVS